MAGLRGRAWEFSQFMAPMLLHGKDLCLFNDRWAGAL